MYLTEKELRGQFEALTRTAALLLSEKEAIKGALDGVKTLCVLGCGSSYSLAKSAALQFSQRTGIPAFAAAAGDVLVNFSTYQTMLRGATVLVLSRSGSTSEAVKVATRCKEELGCKILSICAKEGAPMEGVADWSLLIPWAFDEAVCQTRTVSNLYAAALGMAAIAGGQDETLAALAGLSGHAEGFAPVEPALEALAKAGWSKAVVLADGGAAGLAEEGALAFKEICRRDSNHYHVLDVRHGPMVQIGRDTLVIAWLSSGDRGLQTALLADVKAKTDHLLVLDFAHGADGDIPGIPVELPDCGEDDVKAIFGLYCIQLVCFHHALARGVDPDKPEGLDPWIKL